MKSDKLLENMRKALQGKLVEDINKDFFNHGMGHPGYEIQCITHNTLGFNDLDDFNYVCFKCDRGRPQWKVENNNLVYSINMCKHKPQPKDTKQKIDDFYNEVCLSLNEIIDKYNCYEIESIIFNFKYYTEEGNMESVSKTFIPITKEEVDNEVNNINDDVIIELKNNTKNCLYNLPNFGKSINIKDIAGQELHIGDIVNYRNKLCVVRLKGDNVTLTKMGNYNDSYAPSAVPKSELILTYKASCLFKMSDYREQIIFKSKNIKNCLDICSKYNITVDLNINSDSAHFSYGTLEQKNYGMNKLNIYINDVNNKNANILGLAKDYKLI